MDDPREQFGMFKWVFCKNELECSSDATTRSWPRVMRWKSLTSFFASFSDCTFVENIQVINDKTIMVGYIPSTFS